MTNEQIKLVDDLLDENDIDWECEPVMIGPITWEALKTMRDEWRKAIKVTEEVSDKEFANQSKRFPRS